MKHLFTHGTQTLFALLLMTLAVACSDDGPKDTVTPDPVPCDPNVEDCDAEEPAEGATVFADADLGLRVIIDPAAVEVTGDGGYTLAITEVTLNLRKATLALPSGLDCDAIATAITSELDETAVVVPSCDDSDSPTELGIEGPFSINANADEAAGPDNLAVPAGGFEDIELYVDPLSTDEADDDDVLAGYSLIGYGHYTTETTTAIKFALNMDDSYLIAVSDSSNPISVSADGAQDLIATLDGASWLASVTAEVEACLGNAATVLNAGVLELDAEATSNTDCDGAETKLMDEFAADGVLTIQDQ